MITRSPTVVVGILMVALGTGCRQPEPERLQPLASRTWTGAVPGARLGAAIDLQPSDGILLVGSPGLREPPVPGQAWLLSLGDEEGAVGETTHTAVFSELRMLAGSCVARLPDLDGNGEPDIGVCRSRDGVLYGGVDPNGDVDGYATIEIPDNPGEAIRQFLAMDDGSVVAAGWAGMMVLPSAPSGEVVMGIGGPGDATTYIEFESRPAFEILGESLVEVDGALAFSAVGANQAAVGVLPVPGEAFETAVAWETGNSDPYAGDLILASGNLDADDAAELVVLDRSQLDRVWVVDEPTRGGTLADEDGLPVTKARDVAVSDMDGDGIGDLVVWAEEAPGGSGGAAVFLGPIDATPSSIDRADSFIVAPGVEEETGRFEVGDLDGDGHGDIVFGTPEAGDQGEGRVTVVLSPL